MTHIVTQQAEPSRRPMILNGCDNSNGITGRLISHGDSRVVVLSPACCEIRRLGARVRTAKFDLKCREKTLKRTASSSDKGGGSEDESLWSNNDSARLVRHNIFLPSGDNDEYHYCDSMPKEVMVMGVPAFKNYLVSIQALTGKLIDAVSGPEKKITIFRPRVQHGTNVYGSQEKLGQHETAPASTRTKIENLKNPLVDVKKRWSRANDPVIRFVRWAPTTGVGAAPRRYMRDFFVIELDKKFRSMVGNVLSLGCLSRSSGRLTGHSLDFQSPVDRKRYTKHWLAPPIVVTRVAAILHHEV
ncbi:hypothetical protein C8Q79DRAFT_926820 [Trametes meyenii]|nr:hypothetical protein C8Q79DRAFT_926820 [Trametes meyenii]